MFIAQPRGKIFPAHPIVFAQPTSISEIGIFFYPSSKMEIIMSVRLSGPV